MSEDLNTFDDLVTWATWHVIEGLTRGTPMRSLMHGVLMAAVGWHADRSKKPGSKP